MVPLHPSTRCDLAGRVAETTGFRRGARTLAGGLADGGGYVAFAVGVLLAFPAAIAVCSALGAVLMAADRLTTACPDCGQKRMRHTDSVRTTYPSHRGTGQFYVCEACGGQWFWSNDHRAWRNASTPDFTLDPDEG